jgi:hypothetical protein
MLRGAVRPQFWQTYCVRNLVIRVLSKPLYNCHGESHRWLKI